MSKLKDLKKDPAPKVDEKAGAAKTEAPKTTKTTKTPKPKRERKYTDEELKELRIKNLKKKEREECRCLYTRQCAQEHAGLNLQPVYAKTGGAGWL